MTKAITFQLSSFEGPLDLLLHLIAKNKVSIYDIPLTEILSQYMAILHEAASMDLEIAGDFIAMAAQLMLIKSKLLLPRCDHTAEEEDPRAQLVQMMLAYRQIKCAVPFLQAQGEHGRDLFTKPPAPRQTPAPQAAYHHTAADLLRAGHALLERTARRIPPPAKAFSGIVGREPVPVADKIAEVLEKLLLQGKLPLRRLFDDASSRSEMIAIFLAVLELSKAHRICFDCENAQTTLDLNHEVTAD